MTKKKKRILSGILAISLWVNGAVGSFSSVDIKKGLSLLPDFSQLLVFAENESYFDLDTLVENGVYDADHNVFTLNANTAQYYSGIHPELYQTSKIQITNLGSNLDFTQHHDFQGLGSAEHPFKGTVTYTEGADGYSLMLDEPLFQVLSDSAKIDYISLEGVNSNQSLLAKTIVHDENNTNGLQTKVKCTGDFGGLIQTMDESAIVSLEVADDSLVADNSNAEESAKRPSNITTDGNVGLFCNTMMENSKLTITDFSSSSYSYSVSTVNGNAGGLVGEMQEGSELHIENTLTFQGSVSTNITTNSAGGLVGFCNGSIDIKENIAVNIKGNRTNPITGFCVGGIAGYYKNNKPDYNLNLSQCTINYYATSATYAGGLFGSLQQDENGNSSMTIQGKDDLSTKVTLNTLNDQSIGGLIGCYQSNHLKNTLNIQNFSTEMGNGTTTIGGLISYIPDASYVSINNVKVTLNQTAKNDAISGGIVAKCDSDAFLEISNATVGIASSSSLSGYLYGGLVGYLKGGVLHLSNEIKLLGNFSSNIKSGQILGYRDSAVVYADKGWSLTRPTAVDLSDIGSYGEVISLDDDLAGLFTVDATNHTVHVASFDKDNIANKKDFASLCVSMQAGESNNVLKLGTSVSTSDDIKLSQNANIDMNIDMTGTHITGILRDDGSQVYTGTFDGNGGTITLQIGDIYGKRGTSDASGKGSGQIYHHSYIGLLGRLNNATIQNLTLNGDVHYDSVNATQYAGAVTAYAQGECHFHSVNSNMNFYVAEKLAKTDYKHYIGGFAGFAEGNANLTFDTCTWGGSYQDATEKMKNSGFFGGYIGYVAPGESSVSVNACKIKGSINCLNANSSCITSGLIASMNFDYEKDCDDIAKIQIQGLEVNGASITNKSQNPTGGFLGYLWNQTNVEISGITLSNSTLNLPNSNHFGGLVYAGSGYWQISGNGITFSDAVNIQGNTSDAIPSGLLVCRGDDYVSELLNVTDTANRLNHYLYLSLDLSAYKINAVNLNGLSGLFDEIVGITINSEDGSRNGVVSINTANTANGKVDTNECNTYQSQLSENFKNNKTRYYYNLDTIRENINLSDGVQNADELMCWSLSHYAGDNIRSYFTGESEVKNLITGTINLSGYSYYPIDYFDSLQIENAEIIFDNKTIEDAETSNKKTTDSERQHYLMQYGLLRNAESCNITLKETEWSGNIGADSNYSGALLCGDAKGKIEDLKLKSAIIRTEKYESTPHITFDNLTINGKDNTALFIHSMSDKINLSLDGVVMGNYAENKNIAGSLVGIIGSIEDDDNPENLVVSFSNMGLAKVFSHAYFIDVFSYQDDATCGGTYNFNQGDSLVTYGKELSNYIDNSGTAHGRNAGKQWHYFDSNEAVTDSNKFADEDLTQASGFYTDDYLRYVGNIENTTNHRHELDINQSASEWEGCGTYEDPYRITSGSQLETLAKYLNGNITAGWKIQLDSTAYDNQKFEGTHSANNHISFTADSNGWTSDNSDITVSKAKITEYLRNAYYLIEKDITIGEEFDFTGIGYSTVTGAEEDSNGSSRSFCGVIVGKPNNDGKYPTITVKAPKSAVQNYGGLIRYSNGSVVKNLNIRLEGTITIKSDSMPENREPISQVFYGGVIGYALGGDNIIDNVTVTQDNLTVTGSYDYEANVGGYVGLIGGSITEGGGVIFRNMSGKAGISSVKNNAGDTIVTATEVQTNAQDVETDNTLENAITGGNQYFYWNPYVGRVLDGFALSESGAESGELNNTDKNYKIPTISGSEKVSLSGDGQSIAGITNSKVNSKVTISNAQQLWILSAIGNSGAGSMKTTSDTYDANNQLDYSYDDDSYAYKYGKIRNGNYNGVGNSLNTDSEAYNDEQYWGGVGTSGDGKYSYLVKKYTDNPSISSHLTCTNCSFYLIFSANAEYDMSSYGNGFRGIGTNFEDNATTKVTKRCIPIHGIQGNNAKIKLNRNLFEYSDDIDAWWTQGMGLFPVLYFNRDQAYEKIGFLTISGVVNAYYKQTEHFVDYSSDTYTVDSKTYNYKPITYTGECSAGGFAGMTANGCIKGGSYFKLREIRLENLKVRGQKYSGGLFGIVGMSSRISAKEGARLIGTSNTPFAIMGCSYDHIDLQGAYAVGGFIAVYANADITVNGSNLSSVNNKNLLIKYNDKDVNGTGLTPYTDTTMINSSFGWVKDACYNEYIVCKHSPNASNAKNLSKICNFSGGSGAVGYYYGAGYTFGDVNGKIIMDNLDLYCPQFAYNCDYGIGAVAGLNWSRALKSETGLFEYNGNMEMKNVEMSNIHVEMIVDPDYKGIHPQKTDFYVAPAMGCIIGYNKCTIKVENVTLKDSYVLNGAFAGGMIGCLNGGSLTINAGCSVENVTVFGEGSYAYYDTASAGIVAGAQVTHITINNGFSITNCTVISDGRNGIIAGSSKSSSKTIKMGNVKIDNCISATTGRNVTTQSFLCGNTDPGSEKSIMYTDDFTCSAGLISGGDFSGNEKGLVFTVNKVIISCYNLLVKDSYVGYYVNGAGDLSFDKETKSFISKKNGKAITLNESSIGVYDDSNGGEAYKDIDYSSDTHYTDGYMGFVIGATKTLFLNMVGISVKGGYYPYETNGYNETGVNSSATEYMIYSNYENVQKNTATVPYKIEGTNPSKLSPYMVINPAVSVNGIGKLASDGVSTSVLAKIREEAKSNTINWNDRYKNVDDIVSDFDFDAYCSTYKSVKLNDGFATTYTGDDFGVLIIDTNKSSDIKKRLEDYIAVLTNCPLSLSTLNGVTVSTKQFECVNGKFKATGNNSLTYTSGIWKTDPNNYDNNADKFTLIDIQYASAQGGCYHLQIPVIVKKVMEYSVYVSILNGTEYYNSVYDSAEKAVLAKHGDKITARIDYNYYGDTAYWQSMIDSGSDLLWNYDKKIWIGSNSLPNGTRLILVDEQQGGLAFETITSENSFIKENNSYSIRFSEFSSQIGGSGTWTKESTYLCDLLPLSANEVKITSETLSQTSTYFVKLDTPTDATLRVGTDYYRLATDKEKAIAETLYTITVNGDVSYISEHYFLTIQTPENASGIYNNSISYESATLEGKLPTQKRNTMNGNRYCYHLSSQNGENLTNKENVYIIGDCLEVTSTIATYDDEAMTQQNQNSIDVSNKSGTIYVKISSDVKYSTETAKSYSDAADIKIYQEFVLSPMYFESSGNQIAGTFPAGLKYNYCIQSGDNTLKKYGENPYVLREETESISLQCDEAITGIGISEKNITAQVVLYYEDSTIVDQFPMRTESENYPAIQYKGESLISFVENGTAIYDKTDVDSAMYARNESNHALLTYYAWEHIDRGDGTGTINQLGINPSDAGNNPKIIYTEGDFNYSSISATQIAAAKQIKYELSLYQKQEDKSYSKAVDINKFLAVISIANDAETGGNRSISPEDDCYSVQANWAPSEGLSDNILIQFHILTGSEEELSPPDISDFVYANYKLELKVSLLDQNGTILNESVCSDYIIYTNARVDTEFLSKLK